MENINKVYPVNCVRICLDNKSPVLEGYLCGVAMKDNIPFRGTRELIVKIDKFYDDIGQPQPYQVIRSFRSTEREFKPYNANPERFHTSEEFAAQRGKCATTDIVIFSRHHAEWQGVIKDLDDNVRLRFRSTLEFLTWYEKNVIAV